MRGLKLGGLLLAVSLVGSFTSCSRRTADSSSIKVTGSDTMVNLAQAWRERYQSVNPDVSIQVKGGGSGVGFAALCSGKVDIATASRQIKPTEIELAKKNTGKEPKEYIVGEDALAIYVHPENPLDTITVAQLAEIYGDSGKFTKWADLGIENKACPEDEIIRVSRQNSSGTYQYFKEAVLGEGREYKPGATSQSGSSDVVALVSKTPCAIGYSGMGYRTDKVKAVKVAKSKDDAPIEPSVETVLNHSYPISRPLFLYTLGEPEGHVKEFIDWVLSGKGQAIVEETGYVPVPKKNAEK